MLNKIRKILKKVTQWNPEFDPSIFKDDLAMETDWNPLKGGGSNFRTHKLVSIDYTRIEFKSTIGAKIFSFIFIVVGLAVPAFLGRETIQNTGGLFQSDFYFSFLFGVIFFGAGSFMFYSFSKPVVFDKTKGMYWKGWKPPKRYLAKNSVDEGSRIGNIHAIQLIPELIRSDNKSYVSYELNLVLQDGSRMNVVDHGDPIRIRDDAKILSEFLGVPVWDARTASEF